MPHKLLYLAKASPEELCKPLPDALLPIQIVKRLPSSEWRGRSVELKGQDLGIYFHTFHPSPTSTTGGWFYKNCCFCPFLTLKP
jgi:hypothetical protein